MARTISDAAKIRLTKLTEERMEHTGETFSEAWTKLTGDIGDAYGQGEFRSEPISKIRSKVILDHVFSAGISFEEARIVVHADIERAIAKVVAIRGVCYEEAATVVYSEMGKKSGNVADDNKDFFTPRV
jgi:hypothetical protein